MQVICFPIVQCFSQFSVSAFKWNSFVVLQWTSHLGYSLLDLEIHSLMEATSQPQIHPRLVTIADAAAVLKQSTAADKKKPAIVLRPTALAATPACHDTTCGFCCAMAVMVPHDWELYPGCSDFMSGLQWTCFRGLCQEYLRCIPAWTTKHKPCFYLIYPWYITFRPRANFRVRT